MFTIRQFGMRGGKRLNGVLLAVAAVLSGFLAYGLLSDDLPVFLLKADFDLEHPDCVAPERFALSLYNGSWKTAQRVELLIEARRKVPSRASSPYLWGILVDAKLAPGESWQGCLRPSLSSRSNSVIARSREDFTWSVDTYSADFSE